MLKGSSGWVSRLRWLLLSRFRWPCLLSCGPPVCVVLSYSASLHNHNLTEQIDIRAMPVSRSQSDTSQTERPRYCARSVVPSPSTDARVTSDLPRKLQNVCCCDTPSQPNPLRFSCVTLAWVCVRIHHQATTASRSGGRWSRGVAWSSKR